jgi:hypothetical protein
MTRQMGSGGREVPQGVADKTGLTVILHELVEHHFAEHMHVRDSAAITVSKAAPHCASVGKILSKRLALYTAEEILDLAIQPSSPRLTSVTQFFVAPERVRV